MDGAAPGADVMHIDGRGHLAKHRAHRSLFAALVLAAACSAGGPAAPVPGPPVASVSPAVPAATAAVPRSRRDLSADEALGGHTLARHVGRSDEELRDRLRREPRIGAASSYTDRVTAEETVAATLEASAGKVARWEARQGRRSNLVLDYTAAAPVGNSLRRGARTAAPCAHVLVLLRWHERRSLAYVLTSYPECGR